MKHLLLILFVLPIVALADGGLPSQPYIYVMGAAGMEKSADIVTLSFDIVARAPNQAKANEEVQFHANKVFTLLKDRKIAQDDVIAENLRSEADFEEGQSYRSRGKLLGYVVTRPFQVKVHDISAFPNLVDELIAIGDVEFRGIVPYLSKQKEIEDGLWDKAVADARAQAEKTLKQMGMKIDSVFAVSPVPFPEIQRLIFPANAERVIVTGSNIPTQEDRVPSQYRLAPINVTQSVHVIYLISPAR